MVDGTVRSWLEFPIWGTIVKKYVNKITLLHVARRSCCEHTWRGSVDVDHLFCRTSAFWLFFRPLTLIGGLLSALTTRTPVFSFCFMFFLCIVVFMRFLPIQVRLVGVGGGERGTEIKKIRRGVAGDMSLRTSLCFI